MKKIIIFTTLIVSLALTLTFNIFNHENVVENSIERSESSESKIKESSKDEFDYSKAKEYLENPESYMQNLKEQYQMNEYDHAHGLPPEYFERLKDELVVQEKLVFTDENYATIMYVIDKYYESFEGKEVELIGSIYRESGFSEDQVVIGRRGIENTEAVYGLLSTSPTWNFANDEWVKVRGTLSKTQYLANEVAYLLVEEVSKIEPPKNQYVQDLE